MQTTAQATGLLEGSYNVTITDANDCIVVATATISTIVNTKEILADFNTTIFPNPSSGEFNLIINSKEETSLKVSCFDAYGKEVLSLEKLNAKEEIIVVNLLDQSPGVYFIKIRDEKERRSIVKKILILP